MSKGITFYFLAHTATTVKLPEGFPENTQDLTEEQWDELRCLAEERVRGEYGDWILSDVDKPDLVKGDWF